MTYLAYRKCGFLVIFAGSTSSLSLGSPFSEATCNRMLTRGTVLGLVSDQISVIKTFAFRLMASRSQDGCSSAKCLIYPYIIP